MRSLPSSAGMGRVRTEASGPSCGTCSQMTRPRGRHTSQQRDVSRQAPGCRLLPRLRDQGRPVHRRSGVLLRPPRLGRVLVVATPGARAGHADGRRQRRPQRESEPRNCGFRLSEADGEEKALARCRSPYKQRTRPNPSASASSPRGERRESQTVTSAEVVEAIWGPVEDVNPNANALTGTLADEARVAPGGNVPGDRSWGQVAGLPGAPRSGSGTASVPCANNLIDRESTS
jgi:hypothetical protein